MDTATSKRLDIVISAYRMHSQSFKNGLDGVTEDLGLKRINNNTNHIVWMAGNLTNCRYWAGSALGMADEDPYEDLFKEGRALDESLNYPTLEELKASFASISPKVYQKLLTVSDEQLDKAFPMGMNIPFITENALNIIGMCIGREEYLLGQMGLMRKLLGLKGMSCDIDTSINY